MLALPEPQDTCPGKLHTGNRNSPSEESILQLAKLEGQRRERLLKSGIQLQGLEFALQEFRFCFGSIFLHCVPNPLFWNDNVHSVPLDVGSL